MNKNDVRKWLSNCGNISLTITAAEAKYVGTDAGGWVGVQCLVCGSFLISVFSVKREAEQR